MNSYLKFAIVIVAFIVGFFIGRKTDTIETIKYIKGATVRDTVKIPYPSEETIPPKPSLPIKSDTIYIDSIEYITQKVDTSKIISDYIIRRTYNFNLFDNKDGKLDVSQDIEQNKLTRFSYVYTPIKEVRTIVEKKTFQPFVTGGYITSKHIVLGGGFYINNIGVEYNYLKGDEDFHAIKLNYKLW